MRLPVLLRSVLLARSAELLLTPGPCPSSRTWHRIAASGRSRRSPSVRGSPARRAPGLQAAWRPAPPRAGCEDWHRPHLAVGPGDGDIPAAVPTLRSCTAARFERRRVASSTMFVAWAMMARRPGAGSIGITPRGPLPGPWSGARIGVAAIPAPEPARAEGADRRAGHRPARNAAEGGCTREIRPSRHDTQMWRGPRGGWMPVRMRPRRRRRRGSHRRLVNATRPHPFGGRPLQAGPGRRGAMASGVAMPDARADAPHPVARRSSSVCRYPAGGRVD